MVPILETDYAQVTLDQENDVLKLVWKTECVSDSYRFVYNNIVDLLKKTKFKFFLADIRKLGMIPPSDRIWLQEKILPVLFETCVDKMAAIVVGDIYLQRHIAHINKSLEDVKPIKQFANIEEALKWFKE